MYKEKRKYPRVNVLLGVTITEGDNVSHGVIYNASRGGLMIQTNEPLKVDMLLELAIHATALIKAKARVVWVMRDEDVYKMGVEFKSISPIDSTAWAAFLEHYLS